MTVTTISGFTFNVDKEKLDDWRVVEAIADASNEDDKAAQLRGVAALVRYIFGEKKKAFFKHLASKHEGRIPAEAVNDDVRNIMDQLAAVKN